jgi:hypothetical protein
MRNGSEIEQLPRIKAVAPARAPFSLDVTWQNGERSRVDMTGLVHRSRHFGVFTRQPSEFKKVRVVNFGTGIGWANGLDYAATTLKTMANEQRRMSGAELAAFEKRNNLNSRETAALLDVAERTVRAYRRARALPQPVAIALRALESDSTILAAHYKPVAVRPRGRPREKPAT